MPNRTLKKHSAVLVLTLWWSAFAASLAYAESPQFEKDIQPILTAKCGMCHGKDAKEANLDLRSIASIRRGGDSGPAISKATKTSVLWERIESGEMPPEDEPALTKGEMDLIRQWIADGAKAESTNASEDEWAKRLQQANDYWAFSKPMAAEIPGSKQIPVMLTDHTPISPNHESINEGLQAWYKAESLSIRDGERINQWRDDSGNQRHLKPTWGRADSQTGTPPRLALHSTINGKPAIRFGDTTGLGSPPDRPIDIRGDGAWTIVVVVSMKPPGPATNTSVILGFGDPAPGHNPGRPWSSLLEIHRNSELLSHSGGYGHDARMALHTIWPLYEKPVVLTLIKAPGPMTETTGIFINGNPAGEGVLSGVETSPEIKHRSDFSVFLGRAHSSLGAFRGDISEVAIYNSALDVKQRKALEASLAVKYEISEWANVSPTAPAHPIDAFVREKLQKQGLSHAPKADKRTLIRRAYFDLLGLPPKPDEIEAFLNDNEPFAWQRLIERLLHSPHYGERWGRHWLDVARYADTGGYETDIYYRNAWRYRDYVVKSFNDDKPYDQFVMEQIAADELWPDNLDLEGSYIMDPEKIRHFEALTGTGFYALGPMIHESNMDAKKLSNERLSDWVDTTASAFLGLTFACARCHDHKFDPISQRDYYALQAVFANSREIEVEMQHGMGLADWKQHYPKVLALEEAKLAYKDYEERTREGRTAEQIAKLQELKNELADRLLAIPDTDAQQERYTGIYERPTVTVLGHLQPELVPSIHLLSRGEVSRPKQKMAGGLPEFLNGQRGDASNSLINPFPEGQVNPIKRKTLAQWLTRPDHPLTARVMANRIWQWHFGRGIVATANDFGNMGTPPSHPELLDWLATEFVGRGWSLKSLHRLIMTSHTYQQASDFYTEQHGETDPQNVLLWRMNRRRLEGEAVWDSIHSVAGTINLTLGGRPVMPPLLPEEQTNKSIWVESKLPSHHTRRGLYVIVRRNFNFPLFDLFDAPVNAVSCSGRDVSTVAPQALWLLNNKVAFEQAMHFATRLVTEAGNDANAQIKLAFELALSREPSTQELAEAVTFLQSLQTTDPESPQVVQQGALAKLTPKEASALVKFCLTIINLNEFIYVD